VPLREGIGDAVDGSGGGGGSWRRAGTFAACLPAKVAASKPEPGQEPSNEQRAEWAAIALRAFALTTGVQNDSFETQLSDLLCDLMHLHSQYSAGSTVRFPHLLEWARGQFEEEEVGDGDVAEEQLAPTYTPGPVTIGRTVGGYTLNAVSVGRGYYGTIGTATQRDPHPGQGGGITEAQAEANAKLWAAAPELAASLAALVERYERKHGHCPETTSARAALKTAGVLP
jgi:hypothetical protein